MDAARQLGSRSTGDLVTSAGSVKEIAQQWQEIAKLYGRKRRWIVKSVIHSCTDRAEAEDVAQEAVLRLFIRSRRSKEPMEDKEKISWVVNMARSIAADRQKRMQHDASDAPDTTKQAPGELNGDEHRETSEQRRVNEAIERLSQIEQRCVRLRAEGIPFQTIGQSLGVSMRSAVSHTKNALEKIQHYLGIGETVN